MSAQPSHEAFDPVIGGDEDVHILIVDDRIANLDSLEAILKDTGFRITRAQSGSEALRILLKQQFACCLLDIRMPDMDGFETAQLIRNDAELRHMPIIFVTAEASDQREVSRGYETGAVDFLIKPLEPTIVRSKVKVLGELYRQKVKLARSGAIEALNQELQSVNASLNTANRDLEHFTHIAAHDLREPLRKQRNIIDLLKSEIPAGASSSDSEMLVQVEKLTDQMFGMIDDFRTLTKIDYADIRREPVPMKGLIQSCLDTCADRVSTRAATVSFDTLLESEVIYHSLVKILYGNLIRNAFDHASGSDIELGFTVENGAKARDPRIFGVRNTGSSIPERHFEEIFRIFRKGESRNRENSGIGLSICKRVIDRHNGRIFVESGDDFVHIKFTFGRPE